MATRKRTKVAQNTSEQPPAATPVLQNNTKDRPVLVDKTNQVVTIRALRNRKVYSNQNTETSVTVSKKLFNNGVIQSPRVKSKKQVSTRELCVPRKSSECFVLLEKLDEVSNNKDLICKHRSSPSVGKQTLTKKLGKVVRKKNKCSVVLEKVDKAKIKKDTNDDQQSTTKRLRNIPQKTSKCSSLERNVEEIKKDISPPNADKKTTKKLGNSPQKSSKCSVVVESNVETKDQKKLVYKNISPSSAEKQKACTPEKKIMLYDFKGGSGSNSKTSRKLTSKRIPQRKRIKPQIDTSDEENCDVQNVSKKMKMLASYSQENQKDCTNLHSQTLQLSMNSSVQPLRENNTLSNLSVKSETRKFFKTPMRRQLVEMSLFNYTNQKKNKFSKSSKTFSRKKENSKSCKTKQNLLLKNTQSSKKLPVKPVMLNENSMQSQYNNVATVSNSRIPVLVKPKPNSNEPPVFVKPTSSNNEPVLVKPTISNNEAVLIKPTINNSECSVLVKPTINNSERSVLVKPIINNSERSVLVKPTTSNSEHPVLVKPTTTSTFAPRTESGLEMVTADKMKVASCDETVEEMDVDGWTTRDLSAEEAASKVAETASRINFKRGGATFRLDFTLGESGLESSKQSDKSAAVKQAHTTLPVSSIIPATAAPPVAVAKQKQVRRDKTENNYFTGPVRSFRFLEKYSRKTKRLREEAVYVPAAPSTEHFTLENYFGFDEEPEDEFTLSPVKRQSNTSITGLPLTSTPHNAIIKSVFPQPNRLMVKPKVTESQHKVNMSIARSNCSQILAHGGCGFKSKSSSLSNTKTATFAVPQVWDIPAYTAKNKQVSYGAGSSMVQSSITDYIQNNTQVSSMSDIPFDTSLSNIEADELSITHSQPPRRSYERTLRKRRPVEHDDYMSEEEEEELQTNTLSKRYDRSKRPKRSKKQERMFEKWASNVSSQFDEIDSIALIVE